MKQKLILVTALLAVFSVNAALANQVTFKRAGHHDISITYKVAHKNVGGKTHLSKLYTLRSLANDPVVHFHLNGYDQAGVVIVSVDGHTGIPSQFAKPDQCSLATNRQKTSGSLIFSMIKYSKKHGKITCSTQGGIFG